MSPAYAEWVSELMSEWWMSWGACVNLLQEIFALAAQNLVMHQRPEERKRDERIVLREPSKLFVNKIIVEFCQIIMWRVFVFWVFVCLQAQFYVVAAWQIYCLVIGKFSILEYTQLDQRNNGEGFTCYSCCCCCGCCRYCVVMGGGNVNETDCELRQHKSHVEYCMSSLSLCLSHTRYKIWLWLKNVAYFQAGAYKMHVIKRNRNVRRPKRVSGVA